MAQDNEKLKSELFAVISMMEQQLNKVKQKRKQRLIAERKANLQQSQPRTSKKLRLIKEKIDLMWKELEFEHNIENIVNMENSIENNKKILLQIFTDN